ncbi:MAG: type II secretion system minor pseudopilin GspI [Pseudomonadales bacterium]|nr:type II secretion system minor pseudopilin GspI [Pseudomonadales bacterium]NRA18640.1 type II secretion system minor pseudopilin GspI [Oceanospirillaceae bacterium]
MRASKTSGKQSGFTLIEVMVALMILSIVVTALSLAVSQSTNNIGRLKQHQFAAWVAHNQISLYMLDAQPESSGSSQFAGGKYLWKITSSNTDTAKFYRLRVTVAAAAEPDYLLADLSAFKGEQ